MVKVDTKVDALEEEDQLIAITTMKWDILQGIVHFLETLIFTLSGQCTHN